MQHLAVLTGPQGEILKVICASEQEARNAEARWEAHMLKAAESRTVNLFDDEQEEQQVCPTCGQRKPVDDEEQAVE
jgi:hypothetical protein